MDIKLYYKGNMHILPDGLRTLEEFKKAFYNIYTELPLVRVRVNKVEVCNDDDF